MTSLKNREVFSRNKNLSRITTKPTCGKGAKTIEIFSVSVLQQYSIMFEIMLGFCGNCLVSSEAMACWKKLPQRTCWGLETGEFEFFFPDFAMFFRELVRLFRSCNNFACKKIKSLLCTFRNPQLNLHLLSFSFVFKSLFHQTCRMQCWSR